MGKYDGNSGLHAAVLAVVPQLVSVVTAEDGTITLVFDESVTPVTPAKKAAAQNAMNTYLAAHPIVP